MRATPSDGGRPALSDSSRRTGDARQSPRFAAAHPRRSPGPAPAGPPTTASAGPGLVRGGPILEVNRRDLALLAQAQRAEDLGLDPAQPGPVDERTAKERGADQHDDENNLTHGRGLPAWAHAIIDFDLSKPGRRQ